MHADADPLLTSVFALIEPAVIAQARPAARGARLRPALRRRPRACTPTRCGRRCTTPSGVLGMDPPPTFQNPNDPGGLSFLHAHAPSIVLGAAALSADVPPQAAAFIAARHLTYFRPGHLRAAPGADRHRAQGLALRGDQADRAAVPGRRRARRAGQGGARRARSRATRARRAITWRAWSRSCSRRAAARPQEMGRRRRSHRGSRGLHRRARSRNRRRDHQGRATRARALSRIKND